MLVGRRDVAKKGRGLMSSGATRSRQSGRSASAGEMALVGIARAPRILQNRSRSNPFPPQKGVKQHAAYENARVAEHRLACRTPIDLDLTTGMPIAGILGGSDTVSSPADIRLAEVHYTFGHISFAFAQLVPVVPNMTSNRSVLPRVSESGVTCSSTHGAGPRVSRSVSVHECVERHPVG